MSPWDASVRAGDLLAALKRAGFQVVRQRGSHVVLVDDAGHAPVVPRHKATTLGRGLLRKIAAQAGLTLDELRDLL